MAHTHLGIGALAAAMALAGEARAAAWIAPEGGQEIWSSAAGQRDGLYYFESSAYWEAPLGESVSVVAAPWLEQAYDIEDGWRAEAVAGLKYAISREGPLALAVQGGALWRSDPPANCSEGGVELRLMGGRAMGARGFVNLEAAGRALEGGCGGERLELTAGYRPHADWLGMTQVFFDTPHEGDESLKLQVSLVRFDAAGRGIQLGLRTRLDGDSGEPALVLAFWRRPGD